MDNDVRLVIAILDKLGVERCVLGGNSLGGAVAWRTALAHPARVEKLILVDAGGYPSHPQSVPIGFRLAQLPVINQLLAHALPRSLVVQGLHDVFGDPARVTPEMVDRAIAINQREGNRRALRSIPATPSRQSRAPDPRAEAADPYHLGRARSSNSSRQRRTLPTRYRRPLHCRDCTRRVLFLGRVAEIIKDCKHAITGRRDNARRAQRDQVSGGTGKEQRARRPRAMQRRSEPPRDPGRSRYFVDVTAWI